MNSNGFTKRNLFIGDVQITEDLVCGDMVCEEMTLTGNINLDNKDIVGVNNLETQTINGGSPIVNPATGALDMAGNNIDNNPQLDNLQDKTQYISVVAESTETQFAGSVLINGEISNPSLLRFTNDSVIDGSETDLTISVAGIGKITTDNKIETTSDLKCDNLTAITSITAPQITTLQNQTQYLSASANVSTFSGEVKASTLTATTTISAPQITTLQNKTQYLTASSNVSTFTGEVKASTLTATTTLSAPQITTLQNQTQYLTASANTSTFTGDVKVTNITASGVINGAIVGIGNAQPNQTGYNFPISRPLSSGQVMVTPVSSSNTLLFRTANLDGILNQTSILGVSTTIANALILGSPTYQMPTARGTNSQYIKTDGSGLCSFATFPTPTYGQIGRQLAETVGYSLVANVFKSATTLGGTMDTTFPNSANITPSSINGTLTYTELDTKVLVVELDLRARVADAKNATGLLTLNLISGASTILAYDIARVFNTTERIYLSCKIVQPVATGTVFSFSIGYDSNLTTDLFLSSISLSVYGAGF